MILDRFLRTNVLTWIEHIARKGSLYYLTRTAKNLKGYLERRAKYMSPLGAQVRTVEAWATDLIRLVAKFGATMLSDPTSIYFLIPPLCPTDSAIYRQSAKSPDGLVLTGITNATWEDCISCIDFNTSRATALACGENVFAVGMRSGSITLYNQTTFQEERTFQHLEPVKILRFDNSCRRFASAGWKSIKLWDRVDGQIWSQSLASPCIAIAFDAKHVVGVSKASHVTFWDITDGAVKSDHFYMYQEPDEVYGSTPQKAPLAAAFSPNLEILALGYRGQYVCLWDLNNQDFIGCCSRPAEDGSDTVGLCVGTVLFNPNPDVSILAIGYQDGDLAIFEPWSRQLIIVVEANALSLASSPDGRTLAAGDSCGTVQ
jgi:WD40 repeat protein